MISKQKRKKREPFVFLDWDLWRTDVALRSCSLGARGFWIDALTWMWGDNEDHLTAYDYEEFARLMNCFPGSEAKRYMDELVANGVTYRTIGPNGITIYGGKWFRMLVRSRHIPLRVKKQVLAVGMCCYCGSTDQLTVDHIVPFSEGGTHDISNLQCACRRCNSRKRTKSHAQFLLEVKRG